MRPIKYLISFITPDGYMRDYSVCTADKVSEILMGLENDGSSDVHILCLA